MVYRQIIKAGVYAVAGQAVTLETVETSTQGSRFIVLNVSAEEAAQYQGRIGSIIEIEQV